MKDVMRDQAEYLDDAVLTSNSSTFQSLQVVVH